MSRGVHRINTARTAGHKVDYLEEDKGKDLYRYNHLPSSVTHRLLIAGMPLLMLRRLKDIVDVCIT